MYTGECLLCCTQAKFSAHIGPEKSSGIALRYLRHQVLEDAESAAARFKMGPKELNPKPDPTEKLWQMFELLWPGTFSNGKPRSLDLSRPGSGYIACLVACSFFRTALHAMVGPPPSPHPPDLFQCMTCP